MALRARITALAAAALLLSAGAARAAAPPEIEPAAEALLRATLGRIAAAPRFAFAAEVEIDRPLATGEKIRFNGTLTVAVRRPDRLRVTFDGEPRATRSWFDGKTFTHFDPGGNAYARCETPGSLDDLFPVMRDKLGFTPPLSQLARAKIVEQTLAATRSGFTVGPAVVRGKQTRHLAFRGDAADWQLWISGSDAEPVIERMVITHEQADRQYMATFTSWDFTPELADEVFAFTPPPGAVACEFEPPGE